MKKQDLKTGMLLVFRNGKRAIVMKDTGRPNGLGDVYIGDTTDKTSWGIMNDINEDLTFDNKKDYDIVEVWSFSTNSRGALLTTDHRKLLFKREEYKVIKLNSSYEAIVNKETETVEVGCQRFSFDKITELYKAIQS